MFVTNIHAMTAIYAMTDLFWQTAPVTLSLHLRILNHRLPAPDAELIQAAPKALSWLFPVTFQTWHPFS